VKQRGISVNQLGLNKVDSVNGTNVRHSETWKQSSTRDKVVNDPRTGKVARVAKGREKASACIVYRPDENGNIRAVGVMQRKRKPRTAGNTRHVSKPTMSYADKLAKYGAIAVD
jgi:hypothetical protein